MLRFTSLGSGSSGNATVVEARSGSGTTTRLLIDCGMRLKVLEARLNRAGLSADQLDAIFITHEHGDHIGCAHALSVRYGIPTWMSHGTHAATGAPDFNGLLRIARNAVDIGIGDLLVQPYTVPHDAREPLQLTCSDGASRLGVATDFGHVTPRVLAALSGCSALLLECNHDPALLAASRYPAFLKQRVGGPYGHLANEISAEIARRVADAGPLNRIVAAHLSQQNNHPDLVRQALVGALNGYSVDIGIADAEQGHDWCVV